MMNVTSVKRIHQSDWTDSGVRFLRARDIVAAAKNEEPDDYLYISKEKYEEYSTLSGKVGVSDLLVTGVGTIGVPYLVRNLEPLYFKDGNIIWFQNLDKIDGKFLFYSFSAEQIQGFINESAGIGTVGTYTIESGKKTPISLPNQIEQAKVGEFFQQLDNLITLHQRQPFLQSPPDISLIVQLTPPFYTFSWEQRKVAELGKIYIGLVTTMTAHYTDEGTLLIRNSDIKDGRFEFGEKPIFLEKSFAMANESRMHQIGDVITVHTGDVGTSAVISENEDKSIGFATIVTRPNKTIIDPSYLCTFLNTERHKKWAVAISTGDGRTNYNLGDYFELVVPVPSIKEQKQIAMFIENLNNLITLHQRQTIVYAVIRSIRKVILAERQYFAPPMVRKSP